MDSGKGICVIALFVLADPGGPRTAPRIPPAERHGGWWQRSVWSTPSIGHLKYKTPTVETTQILGGLLGTQ